VLQRAPAFALTFALVLVASAGHATRHSGRGGVPTSRTTAGHVEEDGLPDAGLEVQGEHVVQLDTLRDQRRADDGGAAAPAQPPSVPDVVQAAFAPLGPDAVAWALRVSACESRYDPGAVNASSGASGLFQFLPSTWAASPYAADSPFDPTANALAAAWLYQRSGPAAWSCS
jgi:transglycosylase-like protein with SLT domain